MLKQDWVKTFGPYIDGRRVSAWVHPMLPAWAWETLLVEGEPGAAGPYMTLPRAAASSHPWVGEFADHPLMVRWSER